MNIIPVNNTDSILTSFNLNIWRNTDHYILFMLMKDDWSIAIDYIYSIALFLSPLIVDRQLVDESEMY